MADLSELLGDLYGESPPPPGPGRPEVAGRPSPVLDDDLASALSAALSEAPRLAPPAPVTGPSEPGAEGARQPSPTAPARVWQRSDDDILPGRPRR